MPRLTDDRAKREKCFRAERGCNKIPHKFGKHSLGLPGPVFSSCLCINETCQSTDKAMHLFNYCSSFSLSVHRWECAQKQTFLQTSLVVWKQSSLFHSVHARISYCNHNREEIIFSQILALDMPVLVLFGLSMLKKTRILVERN